MESNGDLALPGFFLNVTGFPYYPVFDAYGMIT
jgi:hypothetical protein